MSRPQKIHPPIKGAFNDILAAIGTGAGKAKKAAQDRERAAEKKRQEEEKRKQEE